MSEENIVSQTSLTKESLVKGKILFSPNNQKSNNDSIEIPSKQYQKKREAFLRLFGVTLEQTSALGKVLQLPEKVKESVINEFIIRGVSKREILTLEIINFSAISDKNKVEEYLLLTKFLKQDLLNRIYVASPLGIKLKELTLSLKTLVAKEHVLLGTAPYFDDFVVETINKIITIAILDNLSEFKSLDIYKGLGDRGLKQAIFENHFLPKINVDNPNLKKQEIKIAIPKKKITSGTNISLNSLIALEKFADENRKQTVKLSSELVEQFKNNNINKLIDIQSNVLEDIPEWLLKEELKTHTKLPNLKDSYEKELQVLTKLENIIFKISKNRRVKSNKLSVLLGFDTKDKKNLSDMSVSIRAIKAFLLNEGFLSDLNSFREILQKNMPLIVKSSAKSADIIRAFQSLACKEFLDRFSDALKEID